MTFSIEPDPMLRQSNRLLDGVADSQREHSEHHETLLSAAPGMLGASKAALAAAHEALVDQTRILHKRLTEHGMGMREFTGVVVEIDDQNGGGFQGAGGGL